jgi:hypothetical protein
MQAAVLQAWHDRQIIHSTCSSKHTCIPFEKQYKFATTYSCWWRTCNLCSSDVVEAAVLQAGMMARSSTAPAASTL